MKFVLHWIFVIAVSVSSCVSGLYSGESVLGTLGAGILPAFLTDNPLPNGFPWNICSPGNADPKDAPNTGVTRHYRFIIKRAKIAPDGYQKDALLINGQFPGPKIEANWGDWIEVRVKNAITGPKEGTSLHWHGLLQRETPWYDGVPSISQCPIAPGSSFTLSLNVYGTSWYHSHYSAQYTGGLLGPMIIYGPSHIQYDEDLGPIMLQDWFHKDYFTIVQGIMSNNSALQAQYSDNTIINGRMPYNCSLVLDGTPCSSQRTYTKFRVRPNRRYKLRLINSGSGGIQYFSIDGHNLTIVSNDFVDINPYDTTIVTLGIGQRSDVIFTPRGKPTDVFWMRTRQYGRYCGRALQPEGKAIILCNKASPDSMPVTKAASLPIDDGTCKNDPLDKTVPYYPMAPPEPSATLNITVNQIINATGHKLFTMDGSVFQANFNNPILLLANQKNYSYPYDLQWNVINWGTNTSVRINMWNNNSSPHPMHLHGHNMWILHEGLGQWDGTIINAQNPQRRDTQNMAPWGHIVIQYNIDNPGIWPFHCHIAWHLSTGMSVSFMERPEEVNQMKIPFIMEQTCVDWKEFTKHNTVDQIDSGI